MSISEQTAEIAAELNISEANVRKCILASERFKQNFNLDIDDQTNECAFYSEVEQKISHVWALSLFIGYNCGHFFRATQGETGRMFSSKHLLDIPLLNHYNKDN